MPSTSSSLAEAISALQRRYGATVVRRGDDPAPAGAWATGLPALDEVLVPGGFPAGRLSVITGGGHLSASGRPGMRHGLDGDPGAPHQVSARLDSTGRPGVPQASPRRFVRPAATGRLTLLQALLAIASRSMPVAYVDLLGTLDPGYLADLGADLDACLVVRPPRGEVGIGLAMARTLVRSGIPWMGVALDPGRVPATAWGHPLNALVEAVWGARAVCCVTAPAPLAAPLAYASSLTLGCLPLSWHEAHGDVVGLRVRLEVTKSRIGAPGASVPLLLRYPRPHAVGDVLGLPTVLPDVVRAHPVPPVAGGAREWPLPAVALGMPAAAQGANHPAPAG